MHTPEYAAADGVVLRAGAASGFGLAVYILHENGDVTVYGHMDKILVKPGQYVQAGRDDRAAGHARGVDRAAPALRGAPGRRERQADRPAAVAAGARRRDLRPAPAVL